MTLPKLPPAFTGALAASGKALAVSYRGESVTLGVGTPTIRLVLHSPRALRALCSLKEDCIAEAYVDGDLDIDGALLEALQHRSLLRSGHWLRRLYNFLLPAIAGQATANRAAIKAHYELPPDFYLAFLDATWPAYSQGIFSAPDEDLAAAIERKFAVAVDSCKIGPGSLVLEVGPGWGAFIRYLLRTGATVTSVANSPQLLRYISTSLISPRLLLVATDFLHFAPRMRFDALTMMGVIEHLPRYSRVCRQIRTLLQPDGYAYLDASAATRKYDMSGFISKHVFPYNHSFLKLDDFLASAHREGLELVSIEDDSDSYRRTLTVWAENLERNRTFVEGRFGRYHYRRFHLYLWGSAHAFGTGDLQCYRLVLRRPP